MGNGYSNKSIVSNLSTVSNSSTGFLCFEKIEARATNRANTVSQKQIHIDKTLFLKPSIGKYKAVLVT